MSSSGARGSGAKKYDSKGSNGFYHFQQLCKSIAGTPSRGGKTQLVADFVAAYSGDKVILARLLLPKVQPRVYHLSDKSLFKVFARVLNADADALERNFETGKNAGDISLVVRDAFRQADDLGSKRSAFSLEDIDKVLDGLAKTGKIDSQAKILGTFVAKATANDVKWLVRLLKKDLYVDCGPRGVLEGFDPNAYKAFQMKADLKHVLGQIGTSRGVVVSGAGLMTPIKPMLCRASKTFADAMKRCKSALIFGEIKYDGERIQIHWDGKQCSFYSRSLKPMAAHKVALIKDLLLKSCPDGTSLILDAEILLWDTKAKAPLPFGTLGKQKRGEFQDATVCLFVFDIMYHNGKSLLEMPIINRRKVLETNLTPIEDQLMFSELNRISSEEQLEALMDEVMEQGLEGLVLKDSMSTYAPGKRHWLKMKRDYLAGGSMADSADLVVLGATYGTTARHGAQFSTFLVGVLDKKTSTFRTVCRAHNGLTDADIANLTKDLKMTPVYKDPTKCPAWLKVKKVVCPDMVVVNPKKSPVFEVTGAEFTYSSRHTSTEDGGKGISIRFPRVTRIRGDKNWKTATSLEELVGLAKTSIRTSASKDALKGKKKGAAAAIPAAVPAPSSSSSKKPSKEPVAMIDSDEEAPSKKRRRDRSESRGADRRRDGDDDEQSRKRRRAKKRPQCKWGRKCYRQNPDHFRRFRHPHLEEATESDLDDDGELRPAKRRDDDADAFERKFSPTESMLGGDSKGSSKEGNGASSSKAGGAAWNKKDKYQPKPAKPRRKKKTAAERREEDREFYGDSDMDEPVFELDTDTRPIETPKPISELDKAVDSAFDKVDDSDEESDADREELKRRKSDVFTSFESVDDPDDALRSLKREFDASVVSAKAEAARVKEAIIAESKEALSSASSHLSGAAKVAEEVEEASKARAKKAREEALAKAKLEHEASVEKAKALQRKQIEEAKDKEARRLAELAEVYKKKKESLERAVELKAKQRVMYQSFVHSPDDEIESKKEPSARKSRAGANKMVDDDEDDKQFSDIEEDTDTEEHHEEHLESLLERANSSLVIDDSGAGDAKESGSNSKQVVDDGDADMTPVLTRADTVEY